MMLARLHGIARAWLIGAMLACVAGDAWATSPRVDVTALLDEADSAIRTDNARVITLLAQLRPEVSEMTVGQRWRLRFLEASEAQYMGRYAEAEAGLRDVMDHSGHAGLAARAMGLLMSNYSFGRRYEDAYTVARRAVGVLPGLRDPQARQSLLSNLSQTLNFAGHPETAIQYARMIAADLPAGESPCSAMALEMAARYTQKDLRSDSRDLGRAIEACTASGSPVLANMMWLTKSTLLIEEGQPDAGLAVLDRIAPSVERVGYFAGRASLYSQRGNAYLALNRNDDARRAAEATVALFKPGAQDNFLMDAYHVLYELAKRDRKDAIALLWYQKFADLERRNVDDLSARTLAYEAVQQRALLQGLEADKLAEQNNALKLEKALSVKAVETSRLYIALLAILLGSVIFWLFRTKRSQLRFRYMSHHDGLTGVLNHQHFMSELERALHDLERRNAPACLVLLDLDHFKHVNDTYGHAIGDAVLKRATATCGQQLRRADIFGRLGGEEFGILLHECHPEQGLVIANCIRAAIEATPVTIDGLIVKYSTSIGVACTMISGYGLQSLRREADAALYRAKGAGRNRVMTDLLGDGLVGA
ncbi:diguanylate cyclase [Luteibacter aegosomatissinici]|uniref:diguanylate cyclase n=1 Tax=Luteibacter aegosomatissinici TaxID=2911539 RepID=UPI001FF99A7E|nr:diguanylate cyclase [Luteibacter aegosomatissinici]UPG95112.1 diguanylate cyclase [Luteibacter aegosomatissinici]